MMTNSKLTCKACKTKVLRDIIIKNNGFCDNCITHTKPCDCECGKEIFSYIKNGNLAQYVSQAHRNKAMNEQMRQRTIDDPDYASKISETRSNAAKKMYDDKPDMRQKRRKENRKRFEDPKEREKIGRKAKEYWSNPERREEQRQRRLDFIENNSEITELMTRASRDYWSNEESRNKKSEQLQTLWQDEEFREKQHQARLGNENAKGSGGKTHGNWQGGMSFEPYDETFNEEFKDKVRARQNYICADFDETCKNTKGNALDVHHINGNKLNSTPENCIALCRSHHSKIRFSAKAQARHKAFIDSL